MLDPIVGAQSLLNQRVVWPYLVPLLCSTWENDPHGPTLVVKTTCSGHGCNLRVTATSAVMPYAKGCIQDNRHAETFEDGILSCSQVVDGADDGLPSDVASDLANPLAIPTRKPFNPLAGS